MKSFIKIVTLLMAEIAGFFAAVLGYEVVKISIGMTYSKGLWGLEIPYLYQTKEIYLMYCLGWSLWFLLLCVIGVFTALRNKKAIPIAISILFLISVLVLLFLNGRYY
ncbi:MAG: hypothetical protein NTW54_00485 [Bacteroidetes bacterium]|nr:hypothetical protein [Bacteroidota bacterium]